MKNFKPQLLPNNPVGEAMNWENLLGNTIQNYLVSVKEDGARVELQYDTQVKGRSLKSIPNVHIQRMHEELQNSIGIFGGIIEAEFYSPEMNFSEIMHFFKTEDITSEHTKLKYEKLWHKSLGGASEEWPYPGRDVEWCTTWHDSLKFYVFDYYLQDGLTKLDRYLMSKELVESAESPHLVLINQFQCKHIDMMYQAYDQAALNNSEGLVLIHKDAPYKFGRHTLNSAMAYKVKDDNLVFDGQILSVEEATEAREGAEKTVNELGRSVTSKLKEDRVPSGMAKGFLVGMEDGNELTVSLKGYDHPARVELLQNAQDYTGKWIKFTGMAPVKASGCPRHAHFEKGNFRDDK
mgnify:CR=1 FL=1|tara:strand:+ start:31 stop:1080 length:1050 start_codon:yes stop_codon:yes gene_type:complete